MKGIGHTKRIILNDAKHFLIKYDHYNKYQRGRWLLCNKMNNEILGWCGLKFHEDSKETDIGYRLFRKHWNLGYATESSHLALQYGFRRLGLDSIIARAAKANIASLKVMQKLGLDYEREFEEHGNIFEQHRIDKYNYMLWADNNNNIVVY